MKKRGRECVRETKTEIKWKRKRVRQTIWERERHKDGKVGKKLYKHSG